VDLPMKRAPPMKVETRYFFKVKNKKTSTKIAGAVKVLMLKKITGYRTASSRDESVRRLDRARAPLLPPSPCDQRLNRN
jgi:hypothetical protein